MTTERKKLRDAAATDGMPWSKVATLVGCSVLGGMKGKGADRFSVFYKISSPIKIYYWQSTRNAFACTETTEEFPGQFSVLKWLLSVVCEAGKKNAVEVVIMIPQNIPFVIPSTRLISNRSS